MQEVIKKAAVLIEALPYIQRFRGEIVVVKFGGSIMDDADGVERILKDVAFMDCVGLRPVLVHGGGKAISRAMQARQLQPTFVQGIRVTDEASMEVVERVLNHEVNPRLVSVLQRFECQARGIHGDDILSVVQRTEQDTQTGAVRDWGYVGEIIEVDCAPVKAFLESGIVPVVTPLGRDKERRIYNINADEAAAALARALQARKLVFLSDVPGLLEDPQVPQTIISHVSAGQIDRLIENGTIAEGMIPKIKGAVQALESGVRKTHIIDAAMPHSLLLELFTDKGVGTEIVP